jgi:hypothetical protein
MTVQLKRAHSSVASEVLDGEVDTLHHHLRVVRFAFRHRARCCSSGCRTPRTPCQESGSGYMPGVSAAASFQETEPYAAGCAGSDSMV